MALTFGIGAEQITTTTQQKDIAEWDSVGHLNLMLSLEDTFGIQLDVEEMARLTSVQGILDFLELKCGS